VIAYPFAADRPFSPDHPNTVFPLRNRLLHQFMACQTRFGFVVKRLSDIETDMEHPEKIISLIIAASLTCFRSNTV
jgi:hypothetical protein